MTAQGLLEDEMPILGPTFDNTVSDLVTPVQDSPLLAWAASCSPAPRETLQPWPCGESPQGLAET